MKTWTPSISFSPPASARKRTSFKINVTQRIIDQVQDEHRNKCGPACEHNLVAEAMAVSLKEQGCTNVEVDTGKLPSGRRSIVRIP